MISRWVRTNSKIVLCDYSALFADGPGYADAAKGWDNKVQDFHEWLMQTRRRPPLPFADDKSVPATRHESRHLTHGQNLTRQPRDLLRLLPAVKLVGITESSWCCGSAGVYNITQPRQSDLL